MAESKSLNVNGKSVTITIDDPEHVVARRRCATIWH